MRFDRYPKCDRGTASPQRVAAAKRAVERDRENCGLFPEMMVHKTVEERLEAVLDGRVTWWRQMRNVVAADWRRARKLVRELPETSRRGLLRYWQTGAFPCQPCYLLTMVHMWRQGRCWWHELAHRRRMQLVGAGKMPSPWAQRRSERRGDNFI